MPRYGADLVSRVIPNSQSEMNSQGFFDFSDSGFGELSNRLQKSASVEGSDLIGFHFRVFGKIRFAGWQEDFKRINLVKSGRDDRENRDGCRKLVVLVIRNVYGPGLRNLVSHGWVKGGKADPALFNIHPNPPGPQTRIRW